MISLKDIKHSNWLQCIELEVAEEQRQFVNPNIFSLAEAFAHSDTNKEDADKYYRCIPFAIYNDEQMVGFTLISYEKECDYDDTPMYEVYRLMIAKEYQGHGYGKEAMKRILEYIKTFPYGKVDYVYASWHPDNIVSANLFLTHGFEIVGNDDDGAVVARLSL